LKVLAVGDIHTKTWIIDEVEKLIENYDAIVFVGDYADDFNKEAPETLATWKKLWSLQYKHGTDKIQLVLGNHDYIYVHRTPTLQTGYNGITQLAINSPANKYLKDWLLSLPITIDLDGVTYSHAGLAKGWNGKLDVENLWHDYSPLWVRPNVGQYAQIPQVFGHTPSETCWEVHKNIWCIDTFSTYADGTPIGDHTILEVENGKTFRKINIENNNDTTRKPDRVL